MTETLTRASEFTGSEEPRQRQDAEPGVFIGTWEEIQTHAEQLRGRRVRVTVLPEQGAQAGAGTPVPLPEEESLAGAFKGRLGEFNFEPPDLSVRTGKRFAEMMAEEYRKAQE